MKLSDIYSGNKQNREIISLTELSQKEYFYITSADILHTQFGERYAFTIKLPDEEQLRLLFADKGFDRDAIANYFFSTTGKDSQTIGPLKLVRKKRYFVMQDYSEKE